MNPPLSQFARPLLQRAESLLQRHGGAVVLLFALCYYGLYHNAGLTLVGEAGSNVLIATRILEGWRPIKDMFIGYNLMWFYPLAWMFQITGPHLLVSQIFFMTLSAITGLLGFFLVRRVTGSALLAALTAGLMILMPGAIFRNYMGFIGTLASFALVRGYVVPSSTALRQCLWMGFCGAALSLCFLIRIEPSLLFTVVWIALALLYPVGFRGEFFKRLRVAVTGTALALAAFAAVHAPFVIHAHQRGFGEEFLHQYSQFFHLFRWELGKEIQKASAPPAIDRTAISPIAVPVVATPTPATPADISSGSNRDGRRSRPGFNDLLVWKGAPFFTLSIYFPVLSTAVMTMGGGLLFLTGVFRAHAQARFLGLVVLTTTGAALGLFPQYFFFRPDSVHLSEFMVPLYPALACAAWAGASFFKAKSWSVGKMGGFVLLLTVILQIVVAFNSLYGRDGSGSLRSARGRSAMFHAPGGIDFRVLPRELKEWEGLRDTILKNSAPGDYLVTYPYVPILNVMAERPSYQFKLYVDNSTEYSDFSAHAIEDLEKNKPAIVVINNRDINKTEMSRFKTWASPFYSYLAANYFLAGTYFSQIEVFVRPDRVTLPAH